MSKFFPPNWVCSKSNENICKVGLTFTLPVYFIVGRRGRRKSANKIVTCAAKLLTIGQRLKLLCINCSVHSISLNVDVTLRFTKIIYNL